MRPFSNGSSDWAHPVCPPRLASHHLLASPIFAPLERYRPSVKEGELPTPPQLVQHIVRLDEGTADEVQLANGDWTKIPSWPSLFLLPDDDYSCEVMRWIPTGRKEGGQPQGRLSSRSLRRMSSRFLRYAAGPSELLAVMDAESQTEMPSATIDSIIEDETTTVDARPGKLLARLVDDGLLGEN